MFAVIVKIPVLDVSVCLSYLLIREDCEKVMHVRESIAFL